MPTILLLGGHGKVALHMTRLLTARGHKVHSVIRDASHVSEIASISPLAVPIVSSIEDATDASADRSMDGVQWVVWSAGAGGKGAKERTKAVDEDAAKRFIAAAIRAPGVSRFLMVSASVARREKAEWWDELDLETYKAAWNAIPAYCAAKCAADEFLWDESRKAEKKDCGWEDICLRPGALTDEPATGKVDLGRARLPGGVTREDVARIGVELLERGTGGTGVWLDLVNGDEPIEEAVERCVAQGVSARD